jgi:hypothetical protein
MEVESVRKREDAELLKIDIWAKGGVESPCKWKNPEDCKDSNKDRDDSIFASLTVAILLVDDDT